MARARARRRVRLEKLNGVARMEGNDKRWLRGLLAGIAIGAALAAGAALLAMPSAPPVASQSVARALTAG